MAYNNYFCTDDYNLNISRGNNNIYSDLDPFTNLENNNFNLSNSSACIGSGIDSISFDIQTEDISFGRISDGNTSWVPCTTPTPNSSNGN